jgi:hypothetical protein
LAHNQYDRHIFKKLNPQILIDLDILII